MSMIISLVIIFMNKSTVVYFEYIKIMYKEFIV